MTARSKESIVIYVMVTILFLLWFIRAPVPVVRVVRLSAVMALRPAVAIRVAVAVAASDPVAAVGRGDHDTTPRLTGRRMR